PTLVGPPTTWSALRGGAVGEGGASSAPTTWFWNRNMVMLTDLRQAVRVLVKSPALSALIVAVLAFGIGANTAMFSIIYGVLLKPLPYADSSRLAALRSIVRAGEGDSAAMPDVVDFRAQSTTLAAIAAYTDYQVAMTGHGEA